MFVAEMPDISSRDAAPDSAAALLGINCRGDARCKTTSCGKKLSDLKARINSLSKWASNLRSGFTDIISHH